MMADIKNIAGPSYSISHVRESEDTNQLMVTITRDGKDVGVIAIKSTSTAGELSNNEFEAITPVNTPEV
jgi:hypothetical protein